MVVDSDGKPTRVGYRENDEGKRVRVSKRNGKDI
jgi:large subunit ribosomal protein L24